MFTPALHTPAVPLFAVLSEHPATDTLRVVATTESHADAAEMVDSRFNAYTVGRVVLFNLSDPDPEDVCDHLGADFMGAAREAFAALPAEVREDAALGAADCRYPEAPTPDCAVRYWIESDPQAEFAAARAALAKAGYRYAETSAATWCDIATDCLVQVVAP